MKTSLLSSRGRRGRNGQHLIDVNSLLEATPFGRQQDWEDSPKGWPQMATYG